MNRFLHSMLAKPLKLERVQTSRASVDAASAAVEVTVPVGGRILYGLVGATYEPSDGDAVTVEMRSTALSLDELPISPNNPAVLLEGARVGLIRDDVSGVLARLDERLGSFPSGAVYFHVGASTSGSSPELFFRLATLALDFLQDPSIPDASLESLISSRIRRQGGVRVDD